MRRPALAALLSAVAAGCGGDGGPAAGPPERGPVEERPAFPEPARAVRAKPFPGEDPRRTRAREEMVERDLRAIGVKEPAVLAAMAAVPRHLFVAPEYIARAYEDTPLPIGHGQTISAPDVVGYMTQALGVKAGDRVLDVGTGSGYQAAVLAEMGCRVWSIEILEPLAESAARTLKAAGYGGVVVKVGDGYLGWPGEAPFDGILVAAAPDHVPKPLIDQLKPGARLVLPVGPAGGVQSLLVVTKGADGSVDEEETLPVRFVPMTRKLGGF